LKWQKKLWPFELIFILLLFLEFSYNIFIFIQEYSSGKVGSTLFSKAYEGLSLLKYDLVFYIISLLLIYSFFAWIQYNYFHYVREFFRITKNYINYILLIGLNSFLVVVVYLINAFLYPSSNHALFFKLLIGSNHYKIVLLIGKIFIGLYFIVFFVLTFGARKKPRIIITWALIIIIFLSFFDLGYQVKKIKHFVAHPPSVNEGINVILIGVDSLNPSHVGYFGYPLRTTPHIDAFLQESIVFSNCYTPLARTFPSWYSILTGQYPLRNGARYNLIKRKYLKLTKWTISNILRSLDQYYTAHFTDETRFSNILPMDGFDYLEHPVMGVKDFVLGILHDFTFTNVFFNSPLGYGVFPWLDNNRAVYRLYNPNYFTNDLIAFLSEFKKKKKVFLAVHFCAPHWPYAAIAPYPYLFSNHANIFGPYDGAIRMADEQVGKFLTALKKEGLYNKSIIILLSDHGESLRGHGFELRETTQNHVVLAIKPVGPFQPYKIDSFVRTIDIAPTVLDLLGKEWGKFPFDGESLVPLIKGKSDEWTDKFILMETGFSFDVPGGVGLALEELIQEGVVFYEFDKQGIITVKEKFHSVLIEKKQRGIQTERWKLILEPLVRGNNNENYKYRLSLYDLINDPKCEINLAFQNLSITQRLFNIMKNYYQEEIRGSFFVDRDPLSKNQNPYN